jgi:hypothetical protein
MGQEEQPGQGEACYAAAGRVVVTVKESCEEGGGKAFFYEVTNTHSSPMTLLLIGSGEGGGVMKIIPENRAERIDAPEGWKGSEVFEEESDLMYLLWEAEGAEGAVPADKSLGGFVARMPERKARKQTLFDLAGNPVTPQDMKDAPFTSYFADGTCARGKVQVGQ